MLDPRAIGPVRFRRHLNGWLRIEGMMSAEAGEVILEYQEIVGAFWRGKVKAIRIPLAGLAAVEVRRRWVFAHSVVLQGRSMAAVEDVPGMSMGRVELPVARADLDAARRFVESLRKPEATPTDGWPGA